MSSDRKSVLVIHTSPMHVTFRSESAKLFYQVLVTHTTSFITAVRSTLARYHHTRTFSCSDLSRIPSYMSRLSPSLLETFRSLRVASFELRHVDCVVMHDEQRMRGLCHQMMVSMLYRFFISFFKITTSQLPIPGPQGLIQGSVRETRLCCTLSHMWVFVRLPFTFPEGIHYSPIQNDSHCWYCAS
jgi:hypothetical protein